MWVIFHVEHNYIIRARMVLPAMHSMDNVCVFSSPMVATLTLKANSACACVTSLEREKVLGWSKRCELANVHFLWEYSYVGMQL